MGSIETKALPLASSLFPYLETALSKLPPSHDPFTITTSTGFLPFRPPLQNLPSAFNVVNDILADTPIITAAGSPGLLAEFKLGPLIDSGALPDLTSEIDSLIASDGRADLAAITAVFRDYSFLASSYLLEPCWDKWSKNNSAGYGLGRQILPKCIAGPLVKTAQILDIPAFMSYAASYALYNYSLVEPEKGAKHYDNIRLIRAFEQGLNPRSSEAGFILTHVHMVSHTADLIKGAVGLLNSIQENKSATHPKDDDDTALQAKASLHEILSAMTIIESCMENMWSQSLPKDYITYRTFIFGITSQSMFPNGVIYEDQFDNQPQFFRGESGANDSIIPLLDYLCEIPMPSNPLTTILKDFKNYRPKPHREFLAHVQSSAAELRVREFCVHNAGLEVAALYLKVLDHVRSFRWRHWLFAREYILKRSSHPTATGGSPIVTWLPNQLGAVMEMMENVYSESGLEGAVEKGRSEWKWVGDMMDSVMDQKVKLQKEVKKYCEERGV